MSLTQAQYQMIMTLGTTIPRIFDMSDVAEHVDAAVPDPPKPAPPTKTSDKDQSPGQIVDLLPELSGAAHTPEGKEVALWSATELQLKVANIVLDLYDGNEVEESALADCLLATTTVHKTQVNYKSMSDGSAAAEVSLQSLKAKDMRGKVARDVFTSGLAKGEQQLLLSFTQSGFDGSKMINADVDTPRVTLSPDYLIALGRFFASPPSEADEASREDPHEAEDEAKAPASPADGPSLSYRFNIVKPRLTVLADHSRRDSDEVQIKVERIIITQQRTMSVAIARLGASLRASNTDLVQFLDDVDFQFSLDQHVDGGRELTAIEAHLTPLVARVSLRDIMALRSIYQTAMNGLSPPGSEAQPAEDPAPMPRRTLDDEVNDTGRIHVSTQSVGLHPGRSYRMLTPA